MPGGEGFPDEAMNDGAVRVLAASRHPAGAGRIATGPSLAGFTPGWDGPRYLVQDNWPVHFHPNLLSGLMPQGCPWPPKLSHSWSVTTVQVWQQPPLPIQILCLPTYASWCKPIEKLWRWLKQKVLHLHTMAEDWPGLRRQVATFLDRFADESPDLLRYVGLLPDSFVKVHHRRAGSPCHDARGDGDDTLISTGFIIAGRAPSDLCSPGLATSPCLAWDRRLPNCAGPTGRLRTRRPAESLREILRAYKRATGTVWVVLTGRSGLCTPEGGDRLLERPCPGSADFD